MIKLMDITWDNFEAVRTLKPTYEQSAFTLDNATFMAQGYLNLKSGYLDTLKAISFQDKPIGFVKWVYVPKNVKPYHLSFDATMIDAFMIDQAYQGKGLGKAAFKEVIKAIKQDKRYHSDKILLLCHQDNHEAHAFFKRLHMKQSSRVKTIRNQTYLWFKYDESI